MSNGYMYLKAYAYNTPILGNLRTCKLREVGGGVEDLRWREGGEIERGRERGVRGERERKGLKEGERRHLY